MGSPGELLGSYFAHSSQPTLQLCLLFFCLDWLF